MSDRDTLQMTTDIDYSNVSIAIPTNGRPSSLRRCIEAVVNNVSQTCRIHVLDSTPADTDSIVLEEYQDVYKTFSTINLMRHKKSIPPGHSRKLLSLSIETELGFFLDDDMEVREGAFSKMHMALIDDGFDIMSGSLIENNSARCIGFLFTELLVGCKKGILKCEVPKRTVPVDSIVHLHDVQPPFLIRMDIFNSVQFDERYDWFFELYDFFYQCYRIGIKVGSHTGALIDHNRQPYLSRSSRYYQDRETDRKRFESKWGVTPEFARC